MATLYVLEQGSMLGIQNGCVVVRKGPCSLQEIPAHQLERIVIFGNSTLTTPAIRYVLEKGIEVAFLSSKGKYRGRLQADCGKNARLRQVQYDLAHDGGFVLQVSRCFVRGKLNNMAALLKRQQRVSARIKQKIKALKKATAQIEHVDTLGSLRGYEGIATRSYFEAFRALLKVDLGFRMRKARPAADPVNAMLNLGYSLVYNQLVSFIHIVGLDPYRGYFHQPAHGHAALASDLIEEWRPLIVDSLILSLVNRRELGAGDFRTGQNRTRLTLKGLKRFLTQFDAKFDRAIMHPRLKKRLSYRQCLEAQVRHFTRVVTRQEAAYQPFYPR